MKDFNHCPRCGSTMHSAVSFAETPSEFWLECDKCNTFVNTYIPQPHQLAVHRDPHLYVGNFGAYGTGKTLTSREEVYKHCFLTPNANVLICANIAPQYEQTIKREIEQDIPKVFVKDYSVQKSYMTLINGARILFRPLDDPDKLRSLNLTMFVMIEASEINGEAFQQLKTRTRNLNATTPKLDEKGNILYNTTDTGQSVPIVDKDWRRGIIESNPDSGWIRTDVLLSSDTITKHGHVLDEYKVLDAMRDKSIATHVASTDVNAFLPPTFIDELCKNKPNWWINRYVFSSFSYSEGLVYPNAMACVVPVYITIIIKPSPRFILEGNDLIMTQNIMPWYAALGTEATVDTIDGRIMVKIPAGIQTGSKIRVAGKGYRDRNGRRGDLYIRVQIVNPSYLTHEMKQVYEKMRQLSNVRVV
jgi:hypothetical protein